jgi:glycosyltransferase involved in cell wall biosynthesis
MQQSILCVNSTLAGQSVIVRKGDVAPLHSWGFSPRLRDRVLSHGLNRYQIVLRARLQGLDLPLLARVVAYLFRGWRCLYLVTPPDILRAVPLLKVLFPGLRVLTWAWTARDIDIYFGTLRKCDHIFCLTEGALQALHEKGLGQRASLQYWGANPAYYTDHFNSPRSFDVALLGITLRDMDLAMNAIVQGGFKVATTEQVMRSLRGRNDLRTVENFITVEHTRSHHDAIALFQSSGVSWIPLRADDEAPTGYTNLAESLLTGTPVVIADSSILPSAVLQLPGVYLYRAGDVNDFVGKTRAALAFISMTPTTCTDIQQAAARLLDGSALSMSIEELLR